MDAIEWLGQWEPITAPGRHSSISPADGACGYPAPYHGQILRAIPVTGTVGGRPSWERSPQVRFWLEPERKSLWQRLKEWMVKPCGQ